MSTALKALDIDVIEGNNLDKISMERKIREFASALAGADIGLFFYAGHGLQVDGNNYLVPVDAALSSTAGLEFEMVRLDAVQRLMESTVKTNILFLDACRNNPLARNLARALGTRSVGIGHGLAPAESGAGTLISFSTQPGNMAYDGDGRNSPYTAALTRHIAAPNEELSSILIKVRNDVMAATARKQVPWEHSALTAALSLSKNTQVKPTPANSDNPLFLAYEQHAELTLWTTIKDFKNEALLNEFLRRFPNGEFSQNAKRILEEVRKTQSSLPSAATIAPPGKLQTDAKTSGTAAAPPPNECDFLAAKPSDQQRVAPGVDYWAIRGPEAAAACRSAVATYPAVNRFKYQLARSLDRARHYEEAIAIYRALSHEHYASASAELGTLFSEGIGIKKDRGEAEKHYREAIRLGDASAMSNLGGMLMSSGRKNEGKDLILKASERGDPGGVTKEAVLYLVGISKPKSKALPILLRAAQMGEASAMLELGQIYSSGKLVEKSPTEAAKWFRKGAELGDPRCMLRLASSYASGDGVEKSDEKAVQLVLAVMASADTSLFNNIIAVIGSFSKTARSKLQEALKASLLYDGPIDGDFGAKTKAGIKSALTKLNKDPIDGRLPETNANAAISRND